MAWNNIMVNAVYEDNSPVENARVFYRLSYRATVLPPQSGYTDSDGHLKIISDQTTNMAQTIRITVVDETLFLENRNNTFTIHDGDVYTLMLNCDDVGITFNFFVGISDALTYELCSINLFQPTYYSGYTKDVNGNYNLYMQEYTDKIQINQRFETTEFKFSAVTPSNVQINEPYIEFTVPYTDIIYSVSYGSAYLVLLKNYSVKIQNINDTINWNDQNLSLTNCEMTFYGYTSANTLITSSQTISSWNGYMNIDATDYSMSPNAGRRFSLLFNPSYNEIKVAKNHYIENISNCFISGDSSGNLFLLTEGCTETDPIIIEREPNVCMTNKDLYDYLVSLTGLRPDLPEGYEQNRVGISTRWFTYLWTDSIRRYLDPEYQTIYPDTVENFKTLFVNQLSTPRVSTVYTNPSSIENSYTLDKLHGYVWDRCFIPEEKEFVENCLTFSIGQNESCGISFNYSSGQRTVYNFEYSTNNGVTWNPYSFGQNGFGETIYLSPEGNTSVKFRRALSNTGTTLSSENYYYYFVTTAGTCTATGNITSLLDGYGLSTTELDSNYCFKHLFKNCIGLKNSPELPETTLTEGCFFGMFYNCTSLLNGPETLPVETLADYCYTNMFDRCTALETAPQLPATTLADYCYANMFQECMSLTTAPQLPATALADYCYTNMFARCTALETAPQLPATTLADYCYANMFQGCTSLTTTPLLQETALTQYCYYGMFSACTSLTTILGLPATALADYCYANMFQGCTSLTTVPQLHAKTMALGCYEHMFGSCSSLTNARTLSAATALEESCFEGMFDSCTSLVTAPIISRNTSMKKNCFKKMFYGCSSLATMPYTGSTFPWQSYAYGCYESMFEGCTSLVNTPSTIFGYNARDYCFKRMFAECTSITNPIRLYANNLGTVSGACESMFEGCSNLISGRTADSLVIGPDCYKNMFKNCVKLGCIEAKFTGTTSGNFTMQNASAYTYNWVAGVSRSGVFYHKNETPGAPGGYGVHWIPNGWETQLLA